MNKNNMDEQEIEALKQKADELEKFKNDSAPKLEAFEKAEAEWKTKEAEYQGQINPNWKKAQGEIKALRNALKDKGVEVGEDGLPKTDEKISMEDIIKRTQETTRQELLNNRLEELLEGFNAEDAKVVRRQYDKLTVGEAVTMQNIRSFVQSAEGASGLSKPNPVLRAANSSGRGPRLQDPKVDVLEDADADVLAGRIGIKIKK